MEEIVVDEIWFAWFPVKMQLIPNPCDECSDRDYLTRCYYDCAPQSPNLPRWVWLRYVRRRTRFAPLINAMAVEYWNDPSVGIYMS